MDWDIVIAEVQCPVCGKSFDEKDDVILTKCDHRFHRSSVVCGTDLSLNQDKPITEARCSICDSRLNSKDELANAACGHPCHRTCVESRLNTRNRGDCRVCHKKPIFDETLNQDTKLTRSTSAEQQDLRRKKSDENVGKNETFTSATRSKASIKHEESFRRSLSCGESRDNVPMVDVSGSSAVFTSDEEYKQPASPITDRKGDTSKSIERIYPILDTSSPITSDSNGHEVSDSTVHEVSDSNSTNILKGTEEEKRQLETSATNLAAPYLPAAVKPRVKSLVSQPRPQSPSPSECEATVHIPDLPYDIDDNTALADTIRQRLSIVFHVEAIDVKCYSNLGIGYLRVKSDETKEYLVNAACKMALYPREESAIISFKDTIEFVSYIVLDQSDDIDIPTSEEVLRRWIDAYNGEAPFLCEQLNTQYPNIFRIASKSLPEMLRVAEKSTIIIKSRRAQVYPCAQCTFLEHLPQSMTENQLRDLISSIIGSKKLSSSSLCIQLNNQMNNACILVTDVARKWTKKDSIYINDQYIRTRKSLSYFLLIRSVRQKSEAEAIIRHDLFSGKARIINHSGQNLIVKVADRNIYENCLRQKKLLLDKKHIYPMMIYTGLSNLETNEIDVDTWYDEEMLQCESSINPFLSQTDHKIFRLKWNARIWLEQLERVSLLQNQDSPNNNTQSKYDHVWANKMRHLLRVTVMLNTLAAIRKGSYIVEDNEIQLRLNSKLKTIVYNHQSKLQLGGSVHILKAPFEATEVKIINEDCLVVYENLVNQGRKPLLLNMASATSPGGGYRKGDGAQEENLFRRSDYFRGLDTDLDKFEQPSARFLCTSTSHLNTIADTRTMYPMDEFGAIYTAGLTVFRQPEMQGYEYMQQPLVDVCSLAMAAYRHPPLDGNMLSSKYAIGMRKKIENIFAIAYHNQHDSLVLSALGCGAFRNPPEHVGQIFRSVIEQYAGFFQLIVFAIIDDHNTGLDFNPQGNFVPFEREFKESHFPAIQLIKKANTMFGPYRLLSEGLTVSDVSIFDSIPCKYGVECRDLLDAKHTRQWSHPPLCSEAGATGVCTQMSNIVHMSSFIHPNTCPQGGQCSDIDDRKHAREFEHPSYCLHGSACQDTSDNHEKVYRHLRACKDRHLCEDYRNRNRAHCDVYRHCKPLCSEGQYCASFHDRRHMTIYQHPFSPPCPWTPYHCALFDEFTKTSNRPRHAEQHCLDFAHVCPFGRNCSEQNPSHRKTTIHVPRHICSLDKGCPKMSEEDHLNSFTHSHIQDIRYLCPNSSTCQERDHTEHRARYRHRLPCKNSSVIPYYDLNKGINFVENQRETIVRILKYIKGDLWTPLATPASASQEILDWLRTARPVYRCRSEVFESILLHEHVMSREYMEYFKKPKFLTHAVLQHSQIKSMSSLRIDSCMEHARNYITALILDIYTKHQFLKIDSDDQQSSLNNADVLRQEEDFLSKSLSVDDVKVIHQLTNQIAQASIKLHTHSMNPIDKKLKADKHVLCILGPHLDSTCGDIVIVLKRAILHHPDANLSVQSAASYASGRCYKSRPWLGLESSSEDERMKLFHETKLHAAIPGYDLAAAMELIALTSFDCCQKTMNIDLATILRRWLKVQSQDTIEARLPQLIPLEYIDRIYMTRSIYESFDPAIAAKLQTVFRHCLIVSSSAEYNRLVSDKLMEQFERRVIQSILKPIQGFTITIPATNFVDNLVLPLTISQAYANSRAQHSKASADKTIYIYWQVINGDMMLTLSNEQVTPKQSPSTMHSLLCYIAEKPIVTTEQYKEDPSYLSVGQPFQHQSQIAVKSSSLYLGCNLDDLMTFCLEIRPTSGQVRLFHVGSNSLYNHDVLSETYDRSVIDLSKLEFLHVSAGHRPVSIRNLFVTFEKQNDLHPSVDIIDQVKSKPVPVVVSEVVKYDVVKKPPSLIPCVQGINCLTQFADAGTAHNTRYSHPCRFAELCRDLESHLTHEPRGVAACTFNQKCKLLTDPCHRALFRHSGLPYFLIPCRFQSKCTDSSDRHRVKYSHGELVLVKIASKESPKASAQYDDRVRPIPCKWGTACRDITDAQHCRNYSHPDAPDQKQGNNRAYNRPNSRPKNDPS